MHRNILNFRDLGGLPVEGGVIKPHRIMRGGLLSKVTPELQDALVEEMKLNQVIDLRTNIEIEQGPNKAHEAINMVQINILGDEAYLNANPADMFETLTERDANNYMLKLNRDLIISEISQNGYKSFFEHLLANETGATYFHCTAGKDRTGLAAALFLRVLGAQETIVWDDYLTTNVLSHDHILAEIEKLRPELGDRAPFFRPILGVDRSFLQASWDAIDATFGSFDTYVSQVLELTPDKLLKLRTLYVEER